MSELSQEVFELESLNLVYVWMKSSCIMELIIRLIVAIISFIYPFLCSFKVNLCQFSKELSKLESLTVINICRISDSFMEMRLRVIASMLLFLSFFLSFPILHIYIENVRQSFLK